MSSVFRIVLSFVLLASALSATVSAETKDCPNANHYRLAIVDVETKNAIHFSEG